MEAGTTAGVVQEPAQEKRKLTPEQIENLNKGREKANQKKRDKASGKGPDWTLYKKPAEDGCSEQLRLYRHVLNNPAEYDTTHAQKTVREIYAASRTRFGESWNALEREHREMLAGLADAAASIATDVPVPVPARVEPVAVPDGGVQRCVALIDKLLGKE